MQRYHTSKHHCEPRQPAAGRHQADHSAHATANRSSKPCPSSNRMALPSSNHITSVRLYVVVRLAQRNKRWPPHVSHAARQLQRNPHVRATNCACACVAAAASTTRGGCQAHPRKPALHGVQGDRKSHLRGRSRVLHVDDPGACQSFGAAEDAPCELVPAACSDVASKGSVIC